MPKSRHRHHRSRRLYDRPDKEYQTKSKRHAVRDSSFSEVRSSSVSQHNSPVPLQHRDGLTTALNEILAFIKAFSQERRASDTSSLCQLPDAGTEDTSPSLGESVANLQPEALPQAVEQTVHQNRGGEPGIPTVLTDHAFFSPF